MKICLAASGGGHVRQLLDLKSFWEGRDRFFVTEDTALGRSIAGAEATYFVPHVALGQARLGHPFRMAADCFRNLMSSWRIITRERPDVVITTGAGSLGFLVLFSRFFGSKVILIDSFARFEHPSAFARIAGPLAHYRIAQAEASARAWNGAEYYNPFRIRDVARPAKRDLLFATVGATLKFDRLVEYVSTAASKGLLPREVLIQTGTGGQSPPNLECVESLDFSTIRNTLLNADIVVCHGGTGSLVTALEAGCKVIAIPRLFEHGEHYDNHQKEITDAFAARGLILTASSQQEFEQALEQCHSFIPQSACTDYSELAVRLAQIVDGTHPISKHADERLP